MLLSVEDSTLWVQVRVHRTQLIVLDVVVRQYSINDTYTVRKTDYHVCIVLRMIGIMQALNVRPTHMAFSTAKLASMCKLSGRC